MVWKYVYCIVVSFFLWNDPVTYGWSLLQLVQKKPRRPLASRISVGTLILLAAAPPSPSVISQTIPSCIQTWYMDRVTMYLSLTSNLASHLASHHLHFTFAHCQPWGCGNLENVCCVVKAGGKEKCFNQNNYCLLRGAVSVCSSSAPPYLWPIDWKILSLTDGFVNFQENFYKLFRWSFSSLLILSSTTTKLL